MTTPTDPVLRDAIGLHIDFAGRITFDDLVIAVASHHFEILYVGPVDQSPFATFKVVLRAAH